MSRAFTASTIWAATSDTSASVQPARGTCGYPTVTNGYPGIPLTWAMASAVVDIVSWTMATAGTPAHSSSTASRKLRALQEPQPPNPVMATVASLVSRAQSSASGGTDTLDFSTGTTPAMALSAANTA